MAGNYSQFDEQVAAFNREYGVNFSFESFERETMRIIGLRALRSSGSKLGAADTAYRDTLFALLRDAVNVRMYKSDEKPLDPMALYEDFEKLMDNYRGACDSELVDPPEASGTWQSTGEVAEAMAEKLSDLKVDKAATIINRYRTRSLRLRDMRADIDKMRENHPVSLEDLTKAVIYLRALNKVVNENADRSGWWKFKNWVQLRAEKRDLEALTAFVMSARGEISKEDYEKIGQIADQDIATGIKEKLAKGKENSKSLKKLTPAEQRALDEKNASELAANPAVKEKMTAEIATLTGSSKLPNAFKVVLHGQVYDRAVEHAQAMWSALDGKNDAEIDEALAEGARECFLGVYSTMRTYSLNTKERIVAAQKVTDMVINQFSPAAFNDKYAKFGEAHFLNTAHDVIDAIMSYDNIESFEDARRIVGEAKFEIKENKIRMDLSDVFGRVSNDQKSPRVETDALTKTLKKDL